MPCHRQTRSNAPGDTCGCSRRRDSSRGAHRTLATQKVVVGALVLSLFLTACADAGESRNPTLNLTIEEAGFVAQGELFRIYGRSADPIVTQVRGEVREYEGQTVWRLDLEVEVTIGNTLSTTSWRMYVAPGPEGPEVVKAEEV